MKSGRIGAFAAVGACCLPGVFYLFVTTNGGMSNSSWFSPAWIEFPGNLLGLISPVGVVGAAVLGYRARRNVSSLLVGGFFILTLAAAVGSWRYWEAIYDLFRPWS